MRREGRQHGLVRTSPSPILPSPSPWNNSPKPVNQFQSPPTAGFFTRVPSKPTNHSKFTGKCGRVRCMGCHVVPACKSKDKSKGTQKIRSSDVVMNHRLLAWRVVDEGGRGLNYAGVSASAVLGHLATEYHDDCDEDYDDGEEEEEYVQDDDEVVGGLGVDWDGLLGVGVEVEVEEVSGEEIGVGIDCESGESSDDDDDRMSFCDVGFVMEEIEGDEDWCMVAEM